MVIGIDPGKKGALCAIQYDYAGNPNIINITPYKDEQKFVQALKSLKQIDSNPYILLEQVHALFGKSAAATFTFGKKYGEIIGILFALELQFSLIPPMKWQANFYKKYNLPTKHENTKKFIAEEVYKIVDSKTKSMLLTPRSKQIDRDLTDAVAIALSYTEE